MRVRAGVSCRVEQVAALQPGKGAERDRQVIWPEGGGANLIDGLVHGPGRQCHAVDVAQLALVGAKTQRRITFDVFDGLETFTDGQLDIARRHIVLVIHKSLRAARHRLAGFGNPECGDGLLGWFLHRELPGVGGKSGAGGCARPGPAGVVQGGAQGPACIAGAHTALAWHRHARLEADQCVVPSGAASRMGIQMNLRVPATGHSHRVAGQAAPLGACLATHHGAYLQRRHYGTTTRLQRHKTAQHFDARRCRAVGQRARSCCPGTHVDDGDLRTRLSEDHGVAIGTVVVAGQHHALPHQHAVQSGVVGQRRRQHDAGQIVVAKHHRTLVGAGSQHHVCSTHAPQPFPKACALGQRQVVGERLADGQEVVVVVTKHHTPADDAHLGHGRQLRLGRARPVAGRLAVDRALQAMGCAAQMRPQLGQNHPRTAAPGRQRGGQPGDTAAGDQHVAVDVLVHIPILVLVGGRRTQATGLADEMLVPHPGLGRPHESLVIKAGRKQRREPAVDAQQVFARARPWVHTLGHQPLVQLDLGHLGVRYRPGTRLQLHQRRRFLDSAGHDGARAVVFPGARQHGLAAGQYGRGQSVTGEALVAAPIEAKFQRPAAVDAVARARNAATTHGAAPTAGATSAFSPGL